jgi:hypothetical protein
MFMISIILIDTRRSSLKMGLLDTVEPILGYIIAIAVILLIATMTFMSAVSTDVINSARTMAQVLVLVALLVGIAAAAKAAKEVA